LTPALILPFSPRRRNSHRRFLVCGCASGKSIRAKFQKSGEAFSLSWRRVALLGIAQRQIRIKFSQKTRKHNNAKPLPASIKTLGDWIQVKRMEKNLTPGHLAAKMGIATTLVRSWEDGTIKPENRQLEILVRLLGLDAGDCPFK
jgi:ribosome-binding protein aMBF1 (putative translation factor)